jgi:hypothetical protein
MTGVPGTVYLLHFDRPYKHARHYLGWTANLQARLDSHRAGHGARIRIGRGLSFDCGNGLHAPLCDGRNCTCSCHS